jgi:hypothetical protein
MTITINANVDDDGNRTIYIDGEECRSDLTLSRSCDTSSAHTDRGSTTNY